MAPRPALRRTVAAAGVALALAGGAAPTVVQASAAPRITDTTTPTSPSTAPSINDDQGEKEMTERRGIGSEGVIGPLGALAALVGIVALLFLTMRRRTRATR